MLIVLDPGHGGKDPGAVGTVIKEKDANLSIARVIKGQLVALGHKVLMTRNDDVFLKPEERTAIANKTDAVLFVSIHCNGSLDKSVAGVETLYSPKDARSFTAATLIQRELFGRVKKYGLPNRNVKPRTNVWVVNHCRMPSVLVECGFISNRGDESLLAAAEYRRAVGEAITSGIVHYLK